MLIIPGESITVATVRDGRFPWLTFPSQGLGEPLKARVTTSNLYLFDDVWVWLRANIFLVIRSRSVRSGIGVASIEQRIAE